MDQPTGQHRAGSSEGCLVGRAPRPVTLDGVVAFVAARQHVSFVELQKAFTGTSGAYTFELASPTNLVLWQGLSLELVELLGEALRTKRVVWEPAHYFVYLADGGALKLPLARQARNYTRPHWLPVVFNVPGVSARRRQARRRAS